MGATGGFARLAAEALAIAETSGDRFSIAVAHEAVGGTMRHMMRLADAESHLDAAVDAFRALGARWELASALTSRGIARRLAGEADEAVKDLLEAYRICRELKERSIITWTAAALARAHVSAGDPAAAPCQGGDRVDRIRETDARGVARLSRRREHVAEGERDAALGARSDLRYGAERGPPRT